MRRAAKVDRNQAEIVVALRSVGATVQLLHSVGKGCPDLLVGHRGQNFLIEVKDWQASNADRKLNAIQQEWHDAWNGRVARVETIAAALMAIGIAPIRNDGSVVGLPS
jgi:hypothetical protein